MVEISCELSPSINSDPGVIIVTALADASTFLIETRFVDINEGIVICTGPDVASTSIGPSCPVNTVSTETETADDPLTQV